MMWFSYSTSYPDLFSLLVYSIFNSYAACTWRQLEGCLKIVGDLLGMYKGDILGHC